MKIYSDDPNLPYKTTKLKALYTKSEIDGLFAKWGVKDVYWHWALTSFASEAYGATEGGLQKFAASLRSPEDGLGIGFDLA